MYYSYVEIKYVATSFSPARTDLALKLLSGLISHYKTETDDGAFASFLSEFEGLLK